MDLIDGDLGTSVATDLSGPEGEAPWIKLDLGSNPCTYGKIRLVAGWIPTKWDYSG